MNFLHLTEISAREFESLATRIVGVEAKRNYRLKHLAHVHRKFSLLQGKLPMPDRLPACGSRFMNEV